MITDKSKTIRFEMLLSPEHKRKLDVLVSLYKMKSRADFFCQQIEWGYRRAVAMGHIKPEAQNESNHSGA